LEFKHPYFRVDSKDDLDNIRRKAPAPRKQAANEDFTTTSHHVSVISEQLTATQQQVQQLQEVYADVLQTNKLLVNEVLVLQKMLNAQKQAQFEMINFLTPYAENRNGSMMASMGANNSASGDIATTVPELRRAKELLLSVTSNATADQELERLHGVYGSPTDSGAIVTPTSMPMLQDPMTDISRYPIYPVGQTVGIDPFHSDHIHKIPYAMPSNLTVNNLAEQQHQQQQQQQQQHQQHHAPMPITLTKAPAQPEQTAELWGPKKPLVFLVEDDKICAKIGIKFLKQMGCEVEHASDGAKAYQRCAEVNRERFDMIFMDIIMPELDGVSASLYIRQHCPSVPIIAMTSNIRPDEVDGYFEHGELSPALENCKVDVLTSVGQA
jgi:osomolarity two-component system response regulator SKN7